MKIVREHLYEVSKGKNSTLTTIGTGRTAMTEAYDNVIRIQPELTQAQDLTTRRPFWLKDDHDDKILTAISEAMKASPSRIMFLNWLDASVQIDAYLKSIVNENDPDTEMRALDVSGTLLCDTKILVNDIKGAAQLIFYEKKWRIKYQYWLLVKPL